ncbi:SDR family NAD(P)-dependent oxidoreductase [Geodermatophilus sabuli]|uniref:SDR family NAD(P)-dependent oxidoreductase n=1 Tax=Geodermatophilus sabuli TaxID=1564158 RepID=A0A7K3VUR4_9ACTN|nr:SDR family NAD(P)-dependent oxidoreductase [Geodermatophilus sabuli]NEK56386.1 SDR family NAD(P)-dependent oxidoreductase [Geodermatophilus sabuli]
MGAQDVVAQGRVAVVTGAASGIGLGLARRFAAEGMKVVMADVEAPVLQAAADDLARDGAQVLPVVTDVADRASVEALRDAAVGEFGAVHLLCNNAGVGGSQDPLWEVPLGDLEWVFGVNMWGVLHGVRAFLPVLQEQDAAHVVNVSSVFGLFAGSLGAYGASKHAVVALSESLHFQLREAGSHVGVTVLCPSAVRTNFDDSARNRPPDAGPPADTSATTRAARDDLHARSAPPKEPDEVAGLVVDAIRTSRFYVLTNDARDTAIRQRAEEIIAGSPPTPPLTW